MSASGKKEPVSIRTTGQDEDDHRLPDHAVCRPAGRQRHDEHVRDEGHRGIRPDAARLGAVQQAAALHGWRVCGRDGGSIHEGGGVPDGDGDHGGHHDRDEAGEEVDAGVGIRRPCGLHQDQASDDGARSEGSRRERYGGRPAGRAFETHSGRSSSIGPPLCYTCRPVRLSDDRGGRRAPEGYRIDYSQTPGISACGTAGSTPARSGSRRRGIPAGGSAPFRHEGHRVSSFPSVIPGRFPA